MTPQSTLSSIQPAVTRAAIVAMLAAAMAGPDPEILSANLCTPGTAILGYRNGRTTRLDYRPDPAPVTA